MREKHHKKKGKTTVAYRLALTDTKKEIAEICSPVIGATGLHRGFNNSTITWLPFMKNMTAKPKDIS